MPLEVLSPSAPLLAPVAASAREEAAEASRIDEGAETIVTASRGEAKSR